METVRSMRQVKNKRPDRIASRRRVRTRQAAGIGSRLELRVWVFAIAVLSAMVYGGRMREAKVFLRRTTRGSL